MPLRYYVPENLPAGMIWKRFENTNPPHSKFWEVTYPLDPNKGTGYWHVKWGAIGALAQEKTWTGTNGRCNGKARSKIAEKIGKGYNLVIAVKGPGQNIAGPYKAANRPPIKVHAVQADAEQDANLRFLADEDKQAIRALLSIGMSCDKVAATLKLKVTQVRAIKAHESMGTYGELPRKSKARPAQPGKRTFYFEDE